MVLCLCLGLIFIQSFWNIVETLVKRNWDLTDHTRSLDAYLELDWKTFDRLKRLWDSLGLHFLFICRANV